MVVRKRFGQFVAEEHRLSFTDFCHRVWLSDDAHTCEVEILKDGQTVAVLIEGIAVHDHQGQKRVCRAAVIDISQQKLVGKLATANLALETEIVRRKQAEEDLKSLNEGLDQRVAEQTQAMQMLHDIATIANHVPNAEQAIEYCLRRVAMHKGWCFGHAFLPAADNPDKLIPGYACYAEDPQRFCRFREVTLGLRLQRGQGLPGRVLASGKLEWTTDLRRDLVECRALVAQELGIGTAVAFPVLLGEKVVAVLEFFSDQVIPTEERIASVLVSVGLQAGRIIERAAFEEYLLAIADDVRRDLAQDLHDDIGQELTGLGFQAMTLAGMLETAAKPAKKLAAAIAAAVDRTRDKVRGLSRGMLPIELEEGLLAGGLEQLAAATCESSRIRCKFTCSHPDPVFESRVSMHLYRIAQEAVGNAMRHSAANRIRITLAQKNGETALRIEDDGTGLPAKAGQTMGMGLRTMRYRAELIGGKLEIGPGGKCGTRVVCRLPSPRTIRNVKSNRDA